MDPPDPFTNFSGRPSPTRRSAELQGPRPAPLKVNKDSHKIKKPPIPPPHNHRHHFPQPSLPPPYQAAAAATSHNPQPVIIYSVSPKVIHTTVSDFMNLVQSLTGTSTATTSAAGDTSPAARFASIENTSPSQRERERSSLYSAAASVSAAAAAHDIEHTTPSERQGEIPTFYSTGTGVAGGAAVYGGAVDDEISRILDESNYFSMGSQNYFPGILSPPPATLPPASPPGMFSPAVSDPFIQAASNMFIPSPSTLFSVPMVSPSPSSSYSHLFNSIFDF